MFRRVLISLSRVGRPIVRQKNSISTAGYSTWRLKSFGKMAAAGLATAVMVPVGVLLVNRQRKSVAALSKETGFHSKVRQDLPTYSYQDVQKHTTAENRIWVVFSQGVYDVTDFVESHPGGERILLAAGKALDPFWAAFPVHKQDYVYELLEEYRIGNIDRKTITPDALQVTDAFALEPVRDSDLVVRAERPFNAEAPLEVLNQHVTPNELFFVRNHLPVPQVDVDKYKLKIIIGNRSCSELTLAHLKKIAPVVTVSSTVQCAGNRRSGMSTLKEVKGLSWETGAISNARWTGVRLRDVLRYAGFDVNADSHGSLRHVQFEGLDSDPVTKDRYAASVPLSIALQPDRDVILCWEMNGEPLPVDHGHPLRVVVPGVVGARQVKWLDKIIVSPDEANSLWQQRDYKQFNPSIDWDTADFSKVPAIQDAPVQSVIVSPQQADKVRLSSESGQSFVSVSGYAYSGAGHKIVRVDVSADGGRSWHDAGFVSEPASTGWDWTLWEAKVPVERDSAKLDLVCKAVDSAHNTQPENVSAVWNFRGLLNNSWHRLNFAFK